MLRHLRVTNFAILSDVAIDFCAGFNALTGETGAGKSLIVEAVNLLRGGRASADIPRAGTDEAVVEAIFELPNDIAASAGAVLEEAGLPDNGREVLVRRVIHRGGRSRTYINGALTTASRLAQLGSYLVDLSGQHQHQGLVDPKRHRAILDTFSGAGDLAAATAAAYQRVRELEAELEELRGASGERIDRIEFLRFQLDELAGAELRPGEDEQLEAERSRLSNVDRLHAAASRAEELLYSETGAAVDKIDGAIAALAPLGASDSMLQETACQLEEARAIAEDAAMALRRYADKLEANPERLSEIEDRLAVLSRLRRKHGPGLDDVIARHDELAAELDRLDGGEERLDELLREVDRARAAAMSVALELSAARKRGAKKLESQVQSALAELGMESAELEIRLDSVELYAGGVERVELRLASNPGEPAKPLARVASGGELSRIMLALKLVLRRADHVSCYVFDEVDAGIGGQAAQAVGRQIRSVADETQVLCVTHLPQIAAFADHHLRVHKSKVDGRTETTVTALSDKQRRDEIARMLSGARLSKQAREHASEMLAQAQAR